MSNAEYVNIIKVTSIPLIQVITCFGLLPEESIQLFHGLSGVIRLRADTLTCSRILQYRTPKSRERSSSLSSGKRLGHCSCLCDRQVIAGTVRATLIYSVLYQVNLGMFGVCVFKTYNVLHIV